MHTWGLLQRGLAYLWYADPPKNARIESYPSGEMIEGSTVTLTCMSEADPPVHTYTWIKKSGAVELKSGKEKTLIFSKIRSEDRGEYLCQAANRIGQQDSPAVSVQVSCEYFWKLTLKLGTEWPITLYVYCGVMNGSHGPHGFVVFEIKYISMVMKCLYYVNILFSSRSPKENNSFIFSW